MDEIITTTHLTPIEVMLQVDDDGTVTASRVYKFLELNPAHFARWCKTNITENEYAEENVDFMAFTINGEWGGQASTDFKLTIPFAKKLSMKAGGERGEEARTYFIHVEDKLKQQAIDLSNLSPQMRLLTEMVTAMAQQELRAKQQELKVNQLEKRVDESARAFKAVKDTIIQRDDDWRRSINLMFNQIVKATGTNDFQGLRSETYKILEERAHCNLNTRLSNMRDRLLETGATKSKINCLTKMDVIENEPRIKEIYTSIVKEFSIRYVS